MGGRKSHSVDRVVGKSPQIQPNKKALLDAIHSENVDKIVSSAAKLISSSDVAVSNIAKAVKFLDFIEENESKSQLNYEERKELASKEWSKLKKQQGIDTPSDIDRIFIDSAAKVIRRGKK